MSQLIDKLNQISREAPQPMGFRAAQPAAARPRLLLITCLPRTLTAASLASYAGSADAVLLHAPEVKPATKTQGMLTARRGTVWGEWLQAAGQDEIARLTRAGSDFIIFGAASTLLTRESEDKTGRILQIAPELSDGMLKAVNDLPVDAVLVDSEEEIGQPLTWHSLMLISRLSKLVAKPRLITMPLTVTPDEIKALWEAGIGGIVIKEAATPSAEGLKKLRKAINEADFLPPRIQGKTSALLPRLSMETGTPAENDEEEEEEE